MSRDWDENQRLFYAGSCHYNAAGKRFGLA